MIECPKISFIVRSSINELGCVVFSARFWYKMMYLFNDEKIARGHFANTVFLRFNNLNFNQDCMSVENFSQIFSKDVIPPNILRVCYLQDINGSIEIDRLKIMLYMMKIIQFPNHMNLENFPYKALVKKLYEDFKEDLKNFHEEDYQLLDIPLGEFINQNFYSSLQGFKK